MFSNQLLKLCIPTQKICKIEMNKYTQVLYRPWRHIAFPKRRPLLVEQNRIYKVLKDDSS